MSSRIGIPINIRFADVGCPHQMNARERHAIDMELQAPRALGRDINAKLRQVDYIEGFRYSIAIYEPRDN
jgi:hypothetical protein